MWLLVGCASWLSDAPACAQDIYAWSDDVLGHMLAEDAEAVADTDLGTEPGTGVFDYDPADAPRARVNGLYTESDGEFRYQVSYAEGYWRTTASVAGRGTVSHAGDLDVEFRAETTDVLGVSRAVGTRLQRTGCNVDRWTWDDGAGLTEAVALSGSYDGGNELVLSGRDDAWSWLEVQRSTGDRVTTVSAMDGRWEERLEVAADGTETRDFGGFTYCWADSLRCEGLWEQAFDGSGALSLQVWSEDDLYADVEGAYAYDGSGSETQVFHDPERTCTLQVDATGCVSTCDDGTSESCG